MDSRIPRSSCWSWFCWTANTVRFSQRSPREVGRWLMLLDDKSSFLSCEREWKCLLSRECREFWVRFKTCKCWSPWKAPGARSERELLCKFKVLSCGTDLNAKAGSWCIWLSCKCSVRVRGGKLGGISARPCWLQSTEFDVEWQRHFSGQPHTIWSRKITLESRSSSPMTNKKQLGWESVCKWHTHFFTIWNHRQCDSELANPFHTMKERLWRRGSVVHHLSQSWARLSISPMSVTVATSVLTLSEASEKILPQWLRN